MGQRCIYFKAPRHDQGFNHRLGAGIHIGPSLKWITEGTVGVDGGVGVTLCISFILRMRSWEQNDHPIITHYVYIHTDIPLFLFLIPTKTTFQLRVCLD